MGIFSATGADAAASDCMCCNLSRRGLLRSFAATAAAGALPASSFAQAAKPAASAIIDTHHHYYPPEVKRSPGVGNALINSWSDQKTLDEMDKNGVRTSMLSMASAPLNWFKMEPDESRKFVRAINDYGAKMVQDYPGRFGLFAYQSMVDVDGTLREIEYAFDTLKADGVNLSTSYVDKYPGDPKFAPIFEELNRRKAIVYFHPTTSACCGGAVPGVGDSWIEVPHDTTRAVLSLLFSGALQKYRDITFLLSHGGGTLPMLVDRIDWLSGHQVKNRKELAPDGIHAEFQRFYYDTANAGYPGSMAALLKLVPPSRIVFGTDYPYVSTEWNLKALRANGLPADAVHGIESENAKAFIPRLRA
jgi:predicted TIM-barrel fold metal-dependent hydrolase